MLSLDSHLFFFGLSLVRFTQVCSLLTVPFFVGLHESDFGTDNWGNWFRVFSFLWTTVVSIVGVVASFLSLRALLWAASAGSVMGLTVTVFNVLFGLRIPSVVLCQGSTRDACMEPGTHCNFLGDVKEWEAFLFSLSLCGLICFQTLASGKVIGLLSSAVRKEQVVEEASILPLEGSMSREVKEVRVEVQKIVPEKETEAKQLAEKVFIPVKSHDDPVSGQNVNFVKDVETTDLVSSKDFSSSISHADTSLNRSRGRGRGRGRGAKK